MIEDPLTIFWYVLFSVIITILLTFALNLLPLDKNIISIALLFVSTYITIYGLVYWYNMEPTKNFTNYILENMELAPSLVVENNSSNLAGNIHVADDVFKDSKIKYKNIDVPIMGPLDGLEPPEVVNRLNYLYNKTASPYKPMKYYDYMTDNDKQLMDGYQILNRKPGSTDMVQYKGELDRWYPTLNKELVNTRDCTSYAPGSPSSCIIPNNGPEHLLDTETNETKELFESYSSIPKSLEVIKLLEKSLYKNAPEYNNADMIADITPSDISKNISRGGVIGYCRSDFCGETHFTAMNKGHETVFNG